MSSVDIDYKATGAMLRKLRDAHGYSQDYLSEVTGVTSSAVSQWENGQRVPPIEKLVKLGYLYCMPIDDIVCKVIYAKPTKKVV